MIMMANNIRGWVKPKFSWHLSYGWGKPLKNLNQWSNPSPLGERQRCYPSTMAIVFTYRRCTSLISAQCNSGNLRVLQWNLPVIWKDLLLAATYEIHIHLITTLQCCFYVFIKDYLLLVYFHKHDTSRLINLFKIKWRGEQNHVILWLVGSVWLAS